MEREDQRRLEKAERSPEALPRVSLHSGCSLRNEGIFQHFPATFIQR